MKDIKNNAGKLSLIATPIGNLEDITFRAVRVLKESDYIVCEDTRTTNNLLKYHNIKDSFSFDSDNLYINDSLSSDSDKSYSNKKLLTFHANSSDKEISKILSLLKQGYNLSYVSDAGTPTISDPGVLLVNKIRDYNLNCEFEKDKVVLESIPGACAVTLAYSLSGAVGNSFVFYGFVPHKKGRETLVKEILNNKYTGIVYESVHRIEKLLLQFKLCEDDLLIENNSDISDRNVEYTKSYKNIKREYVICRELTKIYEEVVIGNIDYCIEYFKNNRDKIRGEFVVIIK